VKAKNNWNNIFKEHEMDRARSPHWTQERVYRVLVGKPERKRPLGRHRSGWKNNIKMDTKEIF
jgi:hypothetical protein